MATSINPFDARKVALQLIGAGVSPASREYHDTDWWKWVAFLTKQIAGFKCVLCSRREGLQAHHSPDGYKRAGNERAGIDTVCLCDRCHKVFHLALLGAKMNERYEVAEDTLKMLTQAIDWSRSSVPTMFVGEDCREVKEMIAQMADMADRLCQKALPIINGAKKRQPTLPFGDRMPRREAA